MSAVDKLREIQDKNKSMICLGLDLDPKRMPAEYAKSIKGMYDFTMKIIAATSDMVCAYKPNMAFYENKGAEGMSLLKSIVEHIPEDVVVILDGKRGDIGNTASFYAEALYKKYGADWVTLSPYMGYDSMRPFLEYEDKGIFVLCLTSNTGSKDFQHLLIDGKPLYQVVAEKVSYWNKEDNCGLVVGATQPEHLKELRAVAADMPLLIPGVGAQGGSLEKAAVYGTDSFRKVAVINVCRSVLYASIGADFADRARDELKRLNDVVKGLRSGEIKIDESPLEQQAESASAAEPQAELPPQVVTTPEPEPPAPEPPAPVDESKVPTQEIPGEPAPEPVQAAPPPEPPKKEWKLPPIPDLPFVKKREDSPQQGGNQQNQNRPPQQQQQQQQQGGQDRRQQSNDRNFRDRNQRFNRNNRQDRRERPRHNNDRNFRRGD